MIRVPSPAWSRAVADHGRGAGLAKLTLALTVAASLTIGGSATDAEVMRGAAFAGATADQADARTVDLESLGANAAVVTAAGRTVYQQAAVALDRLAKSGFPDDRLRAAAITALRKVVRLSYLLAVPNQVLADAVKSAAAGQRTPSEELGPLIEHFDVARAEFHRSTDQLLKHIQFLHSYEVTRQSYSDEIARLPVDDPRENSRLQMLKREIVEREAAELQALIDATIPYAAAQNALTAAISELVPVLAATTTRQAPEAGILLSVYGFFDDQEAEEDGYGLYTYVLLVPGTATGHRNVAFLRELLASTYQSDSELAAVRSQLNIFYVPAQNRTQALVIARSSADPAAAIAAPGVYRYEQAQRLLVRLCTESATRNPQLCASARRGPYLLTLSEPVGASATLSPTRLLVDLSEIHERAFGEFIRAIKEQVMRPDFTDRQKVDTLRLRLLDITLKAADWLDPIKEGVAEIVFLSGDTAQ
jgi:hypothetical protein